MQIDLTLGAVGLELADIAARLYQGTGRIAMDGATLEPIGDGTTYTLTVDADAPGAFYTLTAELDGVGLAESWGATVPPVQIVPIRVDGVTQGDLQAQLFRDGAEVSGMLVFLPLGEVGEPGDYALYGWPITAERWMLRWESAGVIFRRQWGAEVEATAAALTAEQQESVEDITEDGKRVTFVPPPAPISFVSGQAGVPSAQMVHAWFVPLRYARNLVDGKAITARDSQMMTAVGFFAAGAVPGPGWSALVSIQPSTDFPVAAGPGVQRFEVVQLDDVIFEGEVPLLYFLQVRS